MGGKAEIVGPYLRGYASRKVELELRAQGNYHEALFHAIRTYGKSFCRRDVPPYVVHMGARPLFIGGVQQGGVRLGRALQKRLGYTAE